MVGARSRCLNVADSNAPVPSGRMRAGSALILGCFMALSGGVYLALTTNFLATLLTALTVVIYILAYTPRKPATPTNPLVGALHAALPPLTRWAPAGAPPASE